MSYEKRRPIPDDFVVMARDLTRKQAQKRWSCGLPRILEWERESGVTCLSLRSGPEVRPAPADFADVVGLTAPEAKRRWKCGEVTLLRWRRETGLHPRLQQANPLKPVPADFADIAPTLTPMQCRERWSCSPAVLRRWREETGVRVGSLTKVRSGPKMKIPDNLADMAKTMTRTEIAIRCRVQIETVSRWLNASGIRFAKRKMVYRGPVAAALPQRDMSVEGLAKEHLTRIAPVYRASLKKPGATGYIVWGVHMSAEAMIEKAKAKGFDPDAWRRVP